MSGVMLLFRTFSIVSLQNTLRMSYSLLTILGGEKHLQSLKADGLALTVLQILCLFSLRSSPAEDPAQRPQGLMVEAR